MSEVNYATQCPRCGHVNDGGPLDAHRQDECPIDAWGYFVAPLDWVIDTALARPALEVEFERIANARNRRARD